MEKIKEYFDRIGMEYNCGISPDLSLLSALQYAHVTNVPYENTDIVKGIELKLDNESLFKKIVTRGRGGYCFELNGLFKNLLDSLGYSTTQHLARFLRGEPEIPKGRHRIIIADVEGKKYFCDVGVGSRAPRYPLLLEENLLQEQCGEAYIFRKDAVLGWVLTERLENGKFGNYVSFGSEKLFDRDFKTPSFYCEKHPASPFHKLMLSIKTPDGRITVDEATFRIWKNGEIIDSRELSSEELPLYEEKYFGLKQFN